MATHQHNLSRRHLLAGTAAALPLAAVPALPVLAGEDPIFVAIENHRQAWAKFEAAVRAFNKVDERIERTEKRGRPYALIAWRYFSHIGGDEIERAREEFLAQGVADPEEIEREYRDARSRYAEAKRREKEWQDRHGLTPLLEASHEASDAEQEACWNLIPENDQHTTLAGIAALLAYVVEFRDHGRNEWHSRDKDPDEDGPDFPVRFEDDVLTWAARALRSLASRRPAALS